MIVPFPLLLHAEGCMVVNNAGELMSGLECTESGEASGKIPQCLYAMTAGIFTIGRPGSGFPMTYTPMFSVPFR